MNTIKQSLPAIILFVALAALYTTAFVYSFLSVLLLTSLIFFIILCVALSGRNAQLKEINDKLTTSITEMSENVGKLLVQQQMVWGLLKGGEDTKEDKEEDANDTL